MISHCPKCNKLLNFSEKQFGQIEARLATMTAGTLKLKCPHCKIPMELLADGSLADWRQIPRVAAAGRKIPDPPPPPDINWLTTSEFEETTTIKDIPKVLIAMDPGETREMITGAMVELFFQPMAVDTMSDAIDQLQTSQFNTVILHTNFNGESFLHSKLHNLLRKMPMSRRRFIFYVLIGPEFHTLYSLEALSNSANIVINENDIVHMKNIYKKGKAESDAFFAPYIKALREHGVANS